MSTDFTAAPGIAEQIAPGIRRVLAPNRGAFTGPGTNSYILGQGTVALIDPGPDDPTHMDALLAALTPGERVSHVFVTHAHADHAPLARPLADHFGAPVLAFGDTFAGRSPLMQSLAAAGDLGGGEGVCAFTPDTCLPDGAHIEGAGWQVEALWTPGHFGNHMAFAARTAGTSVLFCGDLVMGWTSTLVSPPDGDLTAFMASCRRLRAREAVPYLPGHGAPITAPHARLDWLIAHRLSREAQVLGALADGPATAPALAQQIYTDLDPALQPAAARNVLAHLIDLTQRSLVQPQGRLHAEASFALPSGT